MSYRISFTDAAFEQLEKMKRGDKNSYHKCFELVLAVMAEPRSGIAKPERLKHQDSEVWSRRVNDRYRMIYTIFEEDEYVLVNSFVGHYNDR